MRTLFLCCLILHFACASSNRTKTLLLMGGVGAAAAGAGYVLSPPSVRPEMQAAYLGAIGATAAGVTGMFVFDEQKRSDELERQISVLRKELDVYRDESVSSHAPRLMYETNAPFGKDIPDEYQSLIKPGKWSVFKLNQWVTQSEGSIIHQDRMMKLVPPQLSPRKEEKNELSNP